MQTMEYSPADVAPGFTILHRGQNLLVRDVVWRMGHGLVFYTSCADGYNGPDVWPDLDGTVTVTASQYVERGDMDTRDYPHARVVR